MTSKKRRFKVGDKVRIKKDLNPGYGGCPPRYISSEMVSLGGQVRTISSVLEISLYDYKLSGGGYIWWDDWLEPVDEREALEDLITERMQAVAKAQALVKEAKDMLKDLDKPKVGDTYVDKSGQWTLTVLCVDGVQIGYKVVSNSTGGESRSWLYADTFVRNYTRQTKH